MPRPPGGRFGASLTTWAKPLSSLATYRRGGHLLLGAVLLLPYLVWTDGTVRTLQTHGWRAGLPPALLLLALGAPVAFLGVIRSLEITAARLLLDVDLPTESSRRLPWEARLRSALWFALHLVSGGLAGAIAFAGLGLVFAYSIWSVPICVVALVYAFAGLGALERAMAPVLLGPSAAEQVAAAEAMSQKLAERNRIARELHDSIGHALTASTLQAAAASRVFDADPDFARRTLATIEEVGRAATADLDHALGVLRGDDRASDPPDAPDLADLDDLCATVRHGGVELSWSATGPVTGLPRTVSREAYRMVQEGLTNAVRHADPAVVTLAVDVTADAVHIDLTNPFSEADRRTGGHGLTGMRERAALLGGSVAHDVAGGVWRLVIRLPRSAS